MSEFGVEKYELVDPTILETDYEQYVLDLLSKQGYQHIYGPDIAPNGISPERDSFNEVILIDRLRKKISFLNPTLSTNDIDRVLNKIHSFFSNSMIDSNFAFHEALIYGINIDVKRSDGTTGGELVRLIDYDQPLNNEFLAVNQYTVTYEKNERRADLLLIVNGLPVVLFEFKNPADYSANISDAFNQIQTYKKEIPQLFTYNEICIISDLARTEIGTISSTSPFFKEWKTLDGIDFNIQDLNSAEILTRGVLNRYSLLDIIKNFIVYDNTRNGVIKKIAKSHQYYGVNNLIESTVAASRVKGEKKGGVMWHTQGSGKSLEMVFFTAKISQDFRMGNPTVIFVTDRDDLDTQLFTNFCNCSHILRQTPVVANNRKHLMELLKVASGGVIFTTIHKFFPDESMDKYPLLNDRHNIIVAADEAHRSQYSLIDGFAAHMRDALPNATYVGFTGTPIDQTSRCTTNVFGPYVSVYDFKQSINDGTTVQIYYESRLIKIELPPNKAELVNDVFGEITDGESPELIEAQKQKWAVLEIFVGSDKRLKVLAKDIVDHFEKRQSSMEGNGLIVCMSRRICVQLYDEIIKLRPEWSGSGSDDAYLNVIMSGSASDPPEWQKHIHSKKELEALAENFKDLHHPFKLAIVRDMWLTGFDVPQLHTIYVDKPMKGHGLMQAITRVNRVFADKPGGLVVDYIGISSSLADAVGKYTRSGGSGAVTVSVNDVLPMFISKYNECKNYFSDYDWSWWAVTSRSDRIGKIPSAANYILSIPDCKDKYCRSVKDLERLFNLISTLPEATDKRSDVAFFQTVRTFILKSTSPHPRDVKFKEDAIRQVLSDAIVTEQPMDILEVLGYERADISILSDEFISRIKTMPERNLAAEVLKRVASNQIDLFRKRNIVQSKKFSEMLQESITKYEKRIIDTTEFINALILIAKEMKQSESRGEQLGLTSEELAFYDALADDESAKELMGDEILRSIAMEAAQKINDNITVDWNIREQARAKMRTIIKRLLTKYGYPPDKKESATNLIIEQAELICKSKMGE